MLTPSPERRPFIREPRKVPPDSSDVIRYPAGYSTRTGELQALTQRAMDRLLKLESMPGGKNKSLQGLRQEIMDLFDGDLLELQALANKLDDPKLRAGRSGANIGLFRTREGEYLVRLKKVVSRWLHTPVWSPHASLGFEHSLCLRLASIRNMKISLTF